jgi:hypothetical protein
MAQITKHTGTYGGKPCVVVFRELPQEPENALIVLTGSLDEVQHDDLINVVNSAEAQEANDISHVLNRRQFTDGSNMLNGLHYSKKLTKVPVSQVSLTPAPGQSVPLADVNAEIRKMEFAGNPNTMADVEDVSNTPDPVVPTIQQDAAEDAAQGLIMQAELMKEDGERLIADAEAKLEEAYQLNPDLRPKRGPGRPKKSETA